MKKDQLWKKRKIERMMLEICQLADVPFSEGMLAGMNIVAIIGTCQKIDKETVLSIMGSIYDDVASLSGGLGTPKSPTGTKEDEFNILSIMNEDDKKDKDN